MQAQRSWIDDDGGGVLGRLRASVPSHTGSRAVDDHHIVIHGIVGSNFHPWRSTRDR
jgi:hypothetical protein